MSNIIGTDDRTIITKENFEFFDSVVAVDDLNENGDVISTGSGIIVSPQHVMTAAHVIVDNPNNDLATTTYDENGARIILADDVEDSTRFDNTATNRNLRNIEEYDISTLEGRKRVFPGTGLINLNSSIEGNGEGSNSYDDFLTRDYDIALLNLSEDVSNSTESVKPLGIVAFIDPEDAIGIDVLTAGYPASVAEVDRRISKNFQFVKKDSNGNLIEQNNTYSTPGKVLFKAEGTIVNKESVGLLQKEDYILSRTVDAEPGQSGGGILTFLDGRPDLIQPDSKPRVVGTLSRLDLDTVNVNASAIDKPVYDNIVAEIGRVGGTDNGNELPENAIVGQNFGFSNKDEIAGSYRRERILGLGGDDTLEGMGADDRLEGGSGDDKLKGGSGDDKLTGGAGDDELDGGSDGVLGIGIPGLPEELIPGGDMAIYSGNSDEYDVERSGLLGTTLTITHENGGVDGTDTLRGIEFVQFQDEIRAFPFNDDDVLDDLLNFNGGSGNDNIVGNVLANLIRGEAGNDRLTGDGGDDTLKGNGGNDSLFGGDDDDLLQGAFGNDSIEGGAGKDRLYGNEGSDLFRGGSGNDTLSGGLGFGKDTLKGEAGDDSIAGGGGDDLLQGGNDEDTLFGNGGDDRLFGDAGNDLVYGNTGNDLLHGWSGNDTLKGEDGDDYFNAHGGNDLVQGGFGNDEMYGGAGFDRMYGNSGNDLLFGNIGNDYLAGSDGSDTLKGETGRDTLVGGDNHDLLQGGNNNDTLYGQNGNDRLFGNDGNDRLFGGSGQNMISGGAGEDEFVFTNSSQSVGEITDFTVEDDTLLFKANNFAGVSTIGMISSDMLTIGSGVTDSSDRFVYNPATGNLFYDSDGTGSSQRSKLVELDAGLALTNSDFEMI